MAKNCYCDDAIQAGMVGRLCPIPIRGERFSTRHIMLALAVIFALGAPMAAGSQNAHFTYLEGGFIADFVNDAKGSGATSHWSPATSSARSPPETGAAFPLLILEGRCHRAKPYALLAIETGTSERISGR